MHISEGAEQETYLGKLSSYHDRLVGMSEAFAAVIMPLGNLKLQVEPESSARPSHKRPAGSFSPYPGLHSDPHSPCVSAQDRVVIIGDVYRARLVP